MIRNLLFDLDGTLVDSSGTISAALIHALERAGSEPPDAGAVRAFIGRPLLEIFSEDFGMDEHSARRAIDDYRAQYARLGREGSRVYAHVEEGLAALADAGFRLYVATVKPENIADRVLRDFGLRSRFSGIAGSSLDSQRRHKADIIAHALEVNALAPHRSLMIGDRAEDVNGARQHGIDAIGVAYGFGGRAELDAAGARQVVDGFDEVTALALSECSR
ncbi:HAD hydrolase-like protein [Elongatibacter sediminis]|uniref:HAD hydrolase-like protein n=1 Tax=Elongatibacter sediminis TaxID=3119006 RepID=A0AAW9R7H7_9GAMM